MNTSLPGIDAIINWIEELQVTPSQLTEWLHGATGRYDTPLTQLTPAQQMILLFRITDLVTERVLLKEIIGSSYELNVVTRQAYPTDEQAVAVIDRFIQFSGIAFKPLAEMNPSELVQTCHHIKQYAPRLLFFGNHMKDYAELFSLHYSRERADNLLQEVDYQAPLISSELQSVGDMKSTFNFSIK